MAPIQAEGMDLLGQETWVKPFSNQPLSTSFVHFLDSSRPSMGGESVAVERLKIELEKSSRETG